MPTFVVDAEELIYYEYNDVEADSPEEARQKVMEDAGRRSVDSYSGGFEVTGKRRIDEEGNVFDVYRG